MLREVIERTQKAHSKLDIVALIEPENAGSIRLFEKLGFVREGYAKSIDSYVYTIPGTT